MTSIFEQERRKDFAKSFYEFLADLNTVIITADKRNCTMFEYFNHCIRFWPYRCGATGLDSYLKQINVDITKPRNDKDLLLELELFINLLHWATEQEEIDNCDYDFTISFKQSDVEKESSRLLSNAEYMLEQCCNMKIREETDETFPKYCITKRNVLVDATVNCVPELSDVLLSYYDIRNVDDLEYKKSAITSIYSYMEPNRKIYKGLLCGTISEEFFASVNAFGFRHNTKSQKHLTTEEMEMVCDNLFLMAVYVLQTADVIEYKNKMKDIREN